MGSALDDLIARVRAGEISAEEAAQEAPLHRGDSIGVAIHLSGNVDGVVRFLEANGASNITTRGDYIEAYVPVLLLAEASEQPGVIRVRPIQPSEGSQSGSGIPGNGPAVHGSTAWNQAGYTGSGIKVGVIDSGFEGFAALMGTEVPASVQARCYRWLGEHSQDLENCRGSSHGTVVAESVMDMAPDVTLYIADPQSPGDLSDTVDWMISEGVSVINHSRTWLFDGPGDGTSPSSVSPLNTVDRAAAAGIVWVNAAGNSAQRTWFQRGPFSYSTISVSGEDVRVINFEADNFRNRFHLFGPLQLRWDDTWGGADSNLDLYLVRPAGGDIAYASIDPQSGGGGHYPHEWVETGVTVDIVIAHRSGSEPAWIQLLAWKGFGEMTFSTPETGSITNPAESANPGMLTVGAAPWSNVNSIESYSSRGPTPDGRIKPDLVGADCGQTTAESGRFCGTSQASPHVAGMAALVRQRFPGYSPAQVVSYLKENAEQRINSPDPNNTWGHGFIVLPPNPPQLFGAPSIDSVTAGVNSLSMLWSAPAGDGGSPITAYDLRYIETSADETVDPNWTAVDDVWTSGADALSHELTGLRAGTQYDIQVRALNSTGDGPWSTTVTGTPTIAETPCSTGGAVPDPNNNPALVADCDTLLAVRDTLAGNGTLNWSASTPITSWDGIEVSGTPQRVTVLYLVRQRLTGIIPPELGSLTGLDQLTLIENQLTGPIPSELGNLANLRGLHLFSNRLTGSIPTELGRLTNLQGLGLYDNRLTGSIPSQLADVTNLGALHVETNQLTGPIPPELGRLANLQWLTLHDNQLTGEVPDELGRLTKLEQLWLGGNQFTGCVSADLRSIREIDRTHRLKEIGIPYCDELLSGLSIDPGTLSPQFDAYSTDYTVAARSSRITFSPTNRHNATFEYLDGDDNVLADLDNSQAGHQMDVRAGGVTTIKVRVIAPEHRFGWHTYTFHVSGPGALGAPAIDQIAPGTNSLTVSWTPPSADGGSSITAYDLRHIETPADETVDANWTVVDNVWTSGSGALSYELTGLTGGTPYDVQVRAVSSAADGPWSATAANTPSPADCATGGAVPDGANNPGLVSDCEILLAMRDALRGTGTLDWSTSIPITDWRGVTVGGTPTRVTALYRPYSGLNGVIPAELGNLAKLEELTLTGNQLSGRIPAGLGNLANLRDLSLNSNNLSGEIPAAMGNLSKLAVLLLESNQLTGEIPAELGNLSSLVWLHLDHNQLTGEVPAELGSLSQLERLYLGNNQLTGCVPASLRNVAQNDLENLGLPDCGLGTLPGAPTRLEATSGGQTQIDLSWTAPADDGGSAVTGYRIEVSEDGASWNDLVGDTRSTATGYSHTGLTPGVTRHYRVSAINSAGVGPPSNIANAATGVAPTPDLVVDTPTVSESAPAAGARFTLSATVGNQGNGRSDSTTLRYYQSSDHTITTGDAEVGTDSVSSLDAAESGDESIRLTAPSTPGTYYYGACVETVTGESDTTNNCSPAVTVTIGAAPAPDLVVDTPTVSESAPAAGARFTLSATVRNQGNGASAFTTLRYYQSSDPTITTGDTEVGTDSVFSLDASESGDESVRLTTPSTPGTYYYGACVDAVSDESDTTNNCSPAVTVTVGAAPAPDLVVDAPTVSESAPAAGARFNLGATVRNQGNGSSAFTTLRYYQSSDPTITNGDTEVGTDSVFSLDAAESGDESISLTAPSTAGTYYYGACVDSVSDESDTTNNCSPAVTVTVGAAPAPDLVVDAPTVSESAPAAGARFTLGVTVRNQGNGPSAFTTLRYYQSSDSTITTSDTEVGTDSVFRIDALESGDESIRLTAPSTPGTYYHGACVDSVSDESDTSNNCSVAVTVTVGAAPAPDLVVDTPTVSESAPAAGARFTLGATVRNQGNGPSAFTTLRYYQSADSTITTGDTEVGTDSVSSLDAAESGDESISLTAPSTPGTYYYGACVDAVSGETDTTNNCSVAVTVTVGAAPAPDLVVDAPMVSESAPAAGARFTLNATVRNQGKGPSAFTTLRYYQSTDSTITTGDTEVGTDSVSSLDAAESGDESISLTAPSTPGTYYYGACVDAVSGETDTTNNCSVAVTVTVGAAPAPDLVVDTPTVSESAPAAGARFTLDATVRNQGNGPSAFTTLRYYQSTDSTITNGDTEVGTDSVSSLDASESGDESISLTAPSSAGTFYYGACVDSVSDESDTTNNCSPAVTVTVGAAPAPDLVVDTPTVSESAPAAGARFTLDATVRNQGSGPSAFTTLRYYQSSDSTITTGDTEVGTDSVSSLDAVESGDESISLTAPSTPGTYYYGACVDAVSSETDTTNNCSPAVTVTVGAVTSVPGAPAGLTATANGQTQIDLSWTAPSNDGGATISGYLIEVSTDSSTWSDLESDTQSTTTTYSHTGLTAGSTRHYRVSAINSAGTGRASNVANATTDPSTAQQVGAGTCSTGGAVPDAANNPGLIADCEILLAARDTLRGTATLNWSADTPIASWDAVTVSGTPRRVTRIDTSGEDLNLSGTIPPGLGSLTNLRILRLNSNELTGSIPSELGNLSNLEWLSLWNNELTGAIPRELGNLSALTLLRLEWNELTGTIPAQLGNLTNLDSMSLGGNRLTGPIPAEFGNLTNLRGLSLGGSNSGENQLTGPIPAELKNLNKLQSLNLWKNRISGTIPVWLGDLTDLGTLILASNQLTGTIPVELGNLTKVSQLWLAHNQLTGTIPRELGNLTSVTELHLDDNRLTGDIPAELADLSGLRQLFLANNQLTGCIPEGLRDVAAQHDIAQLDLPDCDTVSSTAVAPGPPTGLTATADGQTQIDLSWSAPSDDGGEAITGYRIEVSTDGSSWSDLVADTGSTTTSYSHTDLTAGATRHYRVSAINSAGTGPASSSDSATTEASPVTKPGAPTGLTATANGQTQIDLSWTAPSDDGGAAITGYRIEVSTDGSSWTNLVADTGSTTTSYSHTGLTAGTTRHYRVSAINSAGTGPASNTDSATTDSASQAVPPNSPANARYSRDGSTIVVSWDAVSEATHYKVYYSDFFDSNCVLISGRPSFCEELAANVAGTTYTHTDPDDDSNYYWITACNSAGCSDIDKLNPAQFIDNRPSAPANVRVSREGPSLVVSWDAVPSATYYKVYYSDFFDSNCQLISGRPTFCEELAANVAGTTYTHTGQSILNPKSPSIKVTDRSSNSLTVRWSDWADTNYYWVTACNSAGCSEIANSSSSSYPLGAQYYQLSRSLSRESGFTLLQSRSTDSSLVDQELEPSTIYYYRILGCNDYGCSDPSQTGGLTESDGTVDIPSTPTGVQGDKVRRLFWPDDARVSWNMVEGATYYKVYQGSKLEVEVSAPQVSYYDGSPNRIFGALASTSYKVQACNKAGCSPFSESVTVSALGEKGERLKHEQ